VVTVFLFDFNVFARGQLAWDIQPALRTVYKRRIICPQENF
jgi:hypothetical protein